MNKFSHFNPKMNAVIIGASGAIGQALVRQLSEDPQIDQLFCFSRHHADIPEADRPSHAKLTQTFIDLSSESSIAKMGKQLIGQPLDLVIIASGLLHDGDLQPEKSLRELNAVQMQRLLQINTIAPALIAQQLLPKMRRDSPCVFAALSARVGSISDNRLGGWYSYRASKAALNMLLKTLSIETHRRLPKAIIAGLHPGTVDSALSMPFQRNVPAGKLFTPEQSAHCLLDVIASLTPLQSGKVFAWDGTEVPP
ncbi:SDR family NAD(P)-dependent oxidoreductase [uncultured Amphritea sp.]|uniref:SDR family NAD(P)-dependent oxidoreductase n=1 Tax=uncultured Amphritea sp. TaxID=981605 RepID=UPI0026332721|nr:SDR family NAD(P)-dependent oxidoreductase [uncultured Amphritea sp.]